MPEELTKTEFLAEIQKRGKINLTSINTTIVKNKWFGYKTGISYGELHQYSVYIGELGWRNPPSLTRDIIFWDKDGFPIGKVNREWALAAIDKLLFEAITKTVTFKSIPENAGVTYKSI